MLDLEFITRTPNIGSGHDSEEAISPYVDISSVSAVMLYPLFLLNEKDNRWIYFGLKFEGYGIRKMRWEDFSQWVNNSQ